MSRIIALLALSVLPLVSTACDKVPLLAPSGSIVTLSVNTTSLPMNGTAQITAMVLEDGGNAPQNGTVVTFATTLGSVDPLEARTENGRVTTTFHAGSRTGTAMVRAQSGDAEAEEVEIVIGAGEGGTVALRIDSVANNGTLIVIVATVLDEAGNRVPRAPVTFTATAGRISPGFVTADANGEARATLTTSAASEVTATSGTATGTISIQAPGSIELAVTSAPPFEVDVPVNFTVTPSGEAFFGDVVVDFGDGTAPQSLGTVSGTRAFSHTFDEAGNFTVTARATGADGVETVSSVAVSVTEPVIAIAVTATPSSVSLANGGNVSFAATPTLPPGSAIASIVWNFGDGSSGPGGQATSHQYTTAGIRTVTVTLSTTEGREGTGQTVVNVTP